MADQAPLETPKPFHSIPLQPSTPTYFQLDLPGVPWYIFNDHMNSYVPDRAQDALESCLVLDISLATDKPMTVIIGGIEVTFGLENNHGEGDEEAGWAKFAGAGRSLAGLEGDSVKRGDFRAKQGHC